MTSLSPTDDIISRVAAFLPKAHELHKQVPFADGHNDIAWCLRSMEPEGPGGLYKEKRSLRKNHRGEVFRGPSHNCLHTDIPRLREGGVGWQFWSVFTPTSKLGPEAVQTTLEQIDLVHRMVERYADTFELAHSAADVQRIFASGKIASMCGIEGGHQINGSMGSLRMFYKLGVRYMTLTHNGGPSWADPALSPTGQFLVEAPRGGLTEFGSEVVLEMNRLGMLVDLSHVHSETMKRVLAISRAPVIFSHSSSRALCNHPRDVPDDVLRLLAANGGVIMVTFVAEFVAGQFWVRGGQVGATVVEVADHIDHIRQVTGGVDCIGIGGDYDGAEDLPRGLEDVGCYHNLTAELLLRGYLEEEVLKVISGNTMRVMLAAERVRDEMQADPAVLPSEAVSPVADLSQSAP